MQNMEFCWHQQILVISYQSIITYCFLAVWTCINLRRIWLWPPLSPRFPGAALLPLHPQSNLFHKTSLDIELMFLLSNKHLDFIENLKHSFHNFVYYKSVFVAPIWKALWICREQGPMFIVFLWPFSINCLSNFFIKFQFVLGPAMASWGNLLSSKPVKDSTKTFLRFAAFGLKQIVNQCMMSLQPSFGYSNILDSHPSDIFVNFCWDFHQMILKTMGNH